MLVIATALPCRTWASLTFRTNSPVKAAFTSSSVTSAPRVVIRNSMGPSCSFMVASKLRTRLYPMCAGNARLFYIYQEKKGMAERSSAPVQMVLLNSATLRYTESPATERLNPTGAIAEAETLSLW